MERILRRGVQHWFCVTRADEVLPPTEGAVEAHPTAAVVVARAGSTLAEAVTRMRSHAHLYSAEVYVLALGGWIVPESEFLSDAADEGERFYFKFVHSGVEDLSEQWARSVMQPFPYSIVDVESLPRALAEPLPLPMPIGPATYAKLDAESVAPMFIPSTRYPAERISGYITAFMNSTVVPGMSENMLQSVWDIAFCNLWRDLLVLVEVSGIEFNRNVADHSGASARPDLMLWILNRLCVMFEEKRENLSDALTDLQRKICKLPAQYFGPVQWILGVALARQDMVVWAMSQGQAPDRASVQLNMRSVKDKADCLRLSINFLRLALSLGDTYRKLTSVPRPFTDLFCNYGSQENITRSLVISYPEVRKTIRPWSLHVEEGFTTADFVSAAYAVKAPTLIRGVVRFRADTYSVDLRPVGYDQMVANEAELVCVVRDVLQALNALHGAGLVHRDLKWKNILKCDDHWMLIDLETVWESGQQPICEWLRAWDESTLVEGRYTEQSDLYLVGKLMNRVLSQHTSASGREFQHKLLRREFLSAQEALATDYMHREGLPEQEQEAVGKTAGAGELPARKENGLAIFKSQAASSVQDSLRMCVNVLQKGKKRPLEAVTPPSEKKIKTPSGKAQVHKTDEKTTPAAPKTPKSSARKDNKDEATPTPNSDPKTKVVEHIL